MNTYWVVLTLKKAKVRNEEIKSLTDKVNPIILHSLNQPTCLARRGYQEYKKTMVPQIAMRKAIEDYTDRLTYGTHFHPRTVD
ncbi:MAG: hypothetical protein AABX11_01255 [Nanoarchaeota archaeon]